MKSVIIVWTAVLLSTIIVPASYVTAQFSKDLPLTLQQLQNGSIDRNLSIDPTEALPLNGTISTSTAGITDTDMNVLPPIGISVIIQNDTVTITNHAVDISTDLQEEAAQQAIESNDDGNSGDEG